MIYYALDPSNEQWHCYVAPKGADGGQEYNCTLSRPREERPKMQPATPSSFDQIVPAELAVFDQAAAIWFVIAVAILVAAICTLRTKRLWVVALFATNVWLLVGLFGLLSMVLFRAQM